MPEQIFTSVDTAIYVSNKAYGGSGGGYFYQQGALRGVTITSIQGWEGKWQLRGLKVKFSDGKSCMYGEAAESATQIFKFQTGETLIELIFYDSHQTGSGGNYRSGGFWFKTNKGREFGAATHKSPHQQYYAEVGSGLLCGVFGREGADIDCLGFAMLRPLKSAVLIDVKYPGLETMPVASTPTEVNRVDYDNSSSVEQTVSLKGETEITTKTAWSVSTSLEYGVKVSVSAGVPEVAQVGTEMSWKVGVTESYDREETKTSKKSYDFPIKVPPQTNVKAHAIMYEDKISTDYEAEMTYNLDSGKIIKYHVEGIYDGLSARGVYVKVKEHPLNSAVDCGSINVKL